MCLAVGKEPTPFASLRGYTSRYARFMSGRKSEPSRPASRGCLLRALVAAAILLAGLVLMIGYPFLRIRIARSRVTSYCEKVEVGRPASLTDMAKAADREGFRVVGPIPDLAPGESRPADPSLAPRQKLMVIDGWFFARWFCDVTTDKGIVSEKRVSFLD